MRILVLGGHGMLGNELLKTLVGPGHHVFAPKEEETDVANEDSVRRCFVSFTPECVIHAAAYANVDGCELNAHLAERVNARGTLHVAQTAREVGASMLYVSTDFVFDGRKRAPYLPDDPPNPLNVYGRTKLEGERYVRKLVERHWIVRTAWMFGKNGRNFVRAILDKADRGGRLEVVDDQRGNPTYAFDLAKALAEIVGSEAYGTWHVTNAGEATWLELAREALALSGRAQPVSPISSVKLDRPARRPYYSVLANPEGPLPFTPLRPWREALPSYLDEIGELAG